MYVYMHVCGGSGGNVVLCVCVCVCVCVWVCVSVEWSSLNADHNACMYS